jgi:uncharacterized membrane protein YphA (DoxX/SURF4 family)
VRLSVAYVFLYAAWQNTKDAAAREWTVGQTALLLDFVSEAQRRLASVICAIAGMIMMYGGGISILIGLEGRVGACALMIFSAMGMAIHRANRQLALQSAAAIGLEAPNVKDKAEALGWSAYGGHLAAGLKNISLIGINALFLLYLSDSGGGPWAKPWALSDVVGVWLWHWSR